MSRAFTPAVGGLYPLGNGIGTTVVSGSSQGSDVFNTRDLQQPGAADFVILGPGSQAWFVGWSIRLLAPNAKPADPLRAFLRVSGSFNIEVPYFFGNGPELRTPVYAQNLAHEYYGFVRVEWPAAEIAWFNQLGTDITLDFQFWGKAW